VFGKKYVICPVLASLLFLSACIKKPSNLKNFDVHGHRGARGIYPENTIQSMLAAIDNGATTLEMDVVITLDHKVILSHEPFMNHNICLDSNLNNISKNREKSFNLYEMTYEEISCFDCGTKGNPEFENQKKVKTHKPLFQEVVSTVERYCKEKNKNKIRYNIEIKRKPQWDEIYHPNVKEFISLVIQEIYALGIEKRCILQSFDVESLNLVHTLKPKLKTSLLVEKGLSIDENLDRLNFTPTIYSPQFQSLSKDQIDYLHLKNILVIPWTVNSRKDMISLIQMGVDGIITDYPGDLVSLIH